MKYTVNVNETSSGSVVVEADSEEDAREKASQEYHNGNVHWNKSDIVISEVVMELDDVSYIDKCGCYIHSLNVENRGNLAEATIIKKIGDNLYLADYNGVKCTAIFNFFTGYYYVDDLYGVIPSNS